VVESDTKPMSSMGDCRTASIARATDGQVVLRREALSRPRNGAAGRVEQDGIGVGPTGVEAQEVQETAYAEGRRGQRATDWL
jgi:hypothetical protein